MRQGKRRSPKEERAVLSNDIASCWKRREGKVKPAKKNRVFTFPERIGGGKKGFIGSRAGERKVNWP